MIRINKQGSGKVHYLSGNHEIMNILGDFRYVLDKHMSSTGKDIRKTLFRRGCG